jgi:hypothetical protein
MRAEMALLYRRRPREAVGITTGVTVQIAQGWGCGICCAGEVDSEYLEAKQMTA